MTTKCYSDPNYSIARDRHPIDEYRSALARASPQDIVTHRLDALEHFLEIARDGDLLHRIGDLAALHPEAGGTARVVAGDLIDAHAEQLGHQQAAVELAQQVSEAVAGVGETFDGELAVQVALLHDVLEDTRIRYDALHADFGQRVADGVWALTKDDELSRAEQLPDCLRRIRMQPREIWMVKLADRITNLQPPPRHWPKAKIREYHQGAQVILEALGEASPFLSLRLSSKIGEYAAHCI